MAKGRFANPLNHGRSWSDSFRRRYYGRRGSLRLWSRLYETMEPVDYITLVANSFPLIHASRPGTTH